MNNKEKNFISAVVYLHNSSEQVVSFFSTINNVFSEHFDKYELIAVDDCSTDDTVDRIRKWAKDLEYPLTILHMSMYQGKEDSMNAGIDAAIGDYVYEFDFTDISYDSCLIYDAYCKALEGNDIVFVCPKKVKGSSKLFYHIFNASSKSTYKLSTDTFSLVTRRAINRVHASNAYMPYRKAAYAASGLRMVSMDFDGSVANNQRQRFSLALDSLALYTNAGYRISIGITLFMMAVALIELVYAIVVYCTGKPIEGWTTMMLVMTIGFLGLFFVLSIVIRFLSLNLDMGFRKQKYLIESIEKIQK